MSQKIDRENVLLDFCFVVVIFQNFITSKDYYMNLCAIIMYFPKIQLFHCNAYFWMHLGSNIEEIEKENFWKKKT